MVSSPTRGEVSSLPVPSTDTLSLDLETGTGMLNMEASPKPRRHRGTDSVPIDYVECWKSNFNTLRSPNFGPYGWLGPWDWLWSGLLIANCLDFLNVEAQVSISNLSPSILFYLPTLYYFVVTKTKDQNQEGLSAQAVHDRYNDKQPSDIQETEASVYSSFIQHQDTEVEGTLSFTSNTRLFQGKVVVSVKATSIPSPSHSQVLITL